MGLMEAQAFSWINFGTMLAALVGAAASVGVLVLAVSQFNEARKEARARATFDFINSTSSDRDFLENRDLFVSLCDKSAEVSLPDFAKDGDCKEHNAILYMLNHYELAARGMLSGALDENFFKAQLKGTFLRQWAAIRPFAVELRTKFENPLIGQAADMIYERWK